MADALCPGCSETVADDARFCEACGHDLGAPVTHRLATSGLPPAACASCAGISFAEQPQGGSYCENCGTRRPAGPDHTEVDFNTLAAVSDIGKRHHHNEDAMGLALLPGAAIAVVCDGVSSSARADTASHAAADAAIRTFVRMIESAPGGAADTAIAEAAMVAAVGSAQAAAVQVADPNGPGTNPPSATFVAAVATRDAITVGWVGDSRAYWIPDAVEAAAARPGTSDGPDPDRPSIGSLDADKPICMTVDDTLGGQLAAAGVDISVGAPNMGALVRWLGADATDTSPHVRVFTPAGPGRAIVCSDGLYRYASDAAALAALTPAGDPIDVARKLVAFALDAGGQDNVTVIVVPFPPPTVL